MLVRAKRLCNTTAAKFVKKSLYLNTYINFTDNTHIEIENCKRVIELNDVYVRLKTSTLTVSIWGENLSVSDFNTDGIVIDGIISSVEFE